jgi:hypothetical protein
VIGILALSTPAWSGLSAIGGALVGGTVTGLATYKIEGRRQEFDKQQRQQDRAREDALNAAVTRGVARVMGSRYEQIAGTIETCLNRNIWVPPEIKFDPAPSLEDRKLVAAAANVWEWQAIATAESALDLAETVREMLPEVRPRSDAGSFEIKKDELPQLQKVVALLRAAQTELDRLANPTPVKA